MTVTLQSAPNHTAENDIYAEQTAMTSIVSYPQRCNLWGDGRFRGNCDGQLFKNLVLRYRATRVADPMMGSGTTRDVIAGLNATGRHNIHYWGADLSTGFDLRTDPLPGPFDFAWLHPPYWNLIRYNDNDPRDLSGCATYEEFCNTLHQCLRNCYQTISPGGRLAILLGDIRRRGTYITLLPTVLAMEGELGQLRSVIIKAQHNCSSNAKSYGRMEDVPIQHEYCVVFKKA